MRPAKRRFFVFAAALVLTAWAPSAPAGRVPLVVNDPANLKRPWTLVGGVPFPKAALRDVKRVRVVDAKGRALPAQVDRVATWRDGSVRWAHVSLTAPTTGRYFLEFGPNVRPPAPTRGLRVTESPSEILVETGAARFRVRRDGLGLDSAELTPGGPVWRDGARGVYALDQKGRRAVAAGLGAKVRWRVVTRGPERIVLRGDGRYVTADAEPLARATVWYTFFRGRPDVKVVHVFYLSRDTDKVWFREIGWRVPIANTQDAQAVFDTAKAHDTDVSRGALAKGETLACGQDHIPCFLDAESRFSLTRAAGGAVKELRAGKAMGEWFDVSDARRGLTIVLRDLAEQWPKELAADTDGMTLKLWAPRGGKALDFRPKALVRDFFGAWADKFPGKRAAFDRLPTNATGSCKTHEFRLIPHRGRPDVAATARAAHAADERVLLLADPEWTCASGALGPAPIHHYDPKRFPDAEAMIEDFYDRTVLPLRAFPVTGFLGWGCNPFLSYRRTKDGRWYAYSYRLQYVVEYNLRRNVWTLFARSANRKYYDYASRFNWWCADWSMHHENFGRKVRGGFARLPNYHWPIFWGNHSEVLDTANSGVDLRNWYLDYYLTGNLRSLEMCHEYADAVRAGWKEAMEKKHYYRWSPFMILRLLSQLYMENWDRDLGKKARFWAHKAFDLTSPNGLTDKPACGCLYKVPRNAISSLDYEWATGDPLARQGILKALDYNRRFALIGKPIGYQTGDGGPLATAYVWTGETKWLKMANGLYEGGLAEFRAQPTLAEELKARGGKFTRLPFRNVSVNLHPLYGMPHIMGALAMHKGEIGPPALVVRGPTDSPSWIVLRKPAGREVFVEFAYEARREDGFRPAVTGPDGSPARGLGENVRKRHYQVTKRRDRRPKAGRLWRLSARVTFPADAPSGDYRINTRGGGRIWVLGSNAPGLALEAPDGVYLAGTGAFNTGQYFRPPPGARTVKLFLGRPVEITDGEGKLRPTKAGELTAAIRGSRPWRIRATFPTFFQVKNGPTLVSCAAALLYTPERLAPASTVADPPKGKYVPGPVGQARRLAGRETIRFARGAARPGGAFDNFPGREGTVEFYFRPDWSSHDLTFKDNLVYRTFVSAGGTRLYYRYGQAQQKGHLYNYVDLFVSGVRKRGYGGNYGISHRMFFHRGRWHHFAATWRLRQETDRRKRTWIVGDFAIFLDGRKQPRGRWYPHALKKPAPFEIRPPSARIVIGPVDGCLDELRISDVVRYEKDFTPRKTPFNPDPNTTALYPFDGTDKAWLRGRR